MKFEKYVTSYLKNYKNAKINWNYEDGCVLMGSVMLYEATGNNFYKDFIVNYMKDFINEDGSINHFEKEQYNIDSIHTGKALFFLFNETKEEKYRKAIDTIMDQLKTHPRTKSNNFWHKNIYPNQIWLDGLYMAQPFYMAYETNFNNKENYRDIINQFENTRKYLYNADKQLYYHGYDEARVQPWADKETGLSKNFWLRAMGWYLMALVDTMDEMSEEIFEQYKTLEELFKEGITGILQYQDKESKLFYQLIDRKDVSNNYLETSGSAMVAYAILKGCRMGALQKEKYQHIGEEIVISLVDNKLILVDDELKLSDMCSVAGLGPGDTRDGSVEYYLSEPIVCDDHKGTGAFMMAYAQMILLKEENSEDISNLITICKNMNVL
jgi:unsaturated rhamnogalacturonyl hydrolase